MLKHLAQHRPKRRDRRHQRGLGLVEMMVGLALGLFIVGGALAMFSTFTNDNRQLLQEARIVQDLRATADLITRDLRRAGYWGDATSGVWSSGGSGTPPKSNYGFLAATGCATATLNQKTTASASNALCWSIAGDSNNAVGSDERYGFELDGGVIYAVVAGATRQALSDPKSITITDLVITPSSQVLPVSDYCTKTCTTNCPEVVVREYEVLIKGHLPGDTAASRFQRSNVRLRNDYVGGACPA
jgi:prepilin peptidase dependent protein B